MPENKKAVIVRLAGVRNAGTVARQYVALVCARVSANSVTIRLWQRPFRRNPWCSTTKVVDAAAVVRDATAREVATGIIGESMPLAVDHVRRLLTA